MYYYNYLNLFCFSQMMIIITTIDNDRYSIVIAVIATGSHYEWYSCYLSLSLSLLLSLLLWLLLSLLLLLSFRSPSPPSSPLLTNFPCINTRFICFSSFLFSTSFVTSIFCSTANPHSVNSWARYSVRGRRRKKG